MNFPYEIKKGPREESHGRFKSALLTFFGLAVVASLYFDPFPAWELLVFFSACPLPVMVFSFWS